MKNPYAIALVSALITAGVIKGSACACRDAGRRSDARQLCADRRSRPLERERWQRTLDQRLAQAAREVCGTASDADLVGQNKARECRPDVIAQAESERDALLAAAERGATIAIASR